MKLKKNNKGGEIPENKVLWLMENEAYEKTPARVVDNVWTLLVPYSNGIKCYIKNLNIVVAIRGTADVKDIKADLQIVYSGITNSSRFKEDLKILKEVQSRWSPTRYNYYGVGHSLGGAILDEFIDLGYIKSGVSYNPAVDLIKFRNDTRNHRIYNPNDILYNIMGRFTKNPEVRKSNLSLIEKLASKTTSGKLAVGIKYHLLSNFKGGVVTHNFILI